MWRPCIKRAASACLSRGQTRLYSTQYEYGCTGSGLGARATVSFVTGHEVKTDLPSKLGGKDEHPQPVELVLAGLIGCEVSTASFVARHMVPRFPLGSIAFDYRASRDGSAPVSLPLDVELPASPVIRTVTGTVTVTVAPSAGEETQDRVDELKRHTGARCPVHRTLAAAGVKFEAEWKLQGR